MDTSKYLKSAIMSGLVLGFIFIAYSMLLYVFEVNYFSIGFGILNFLIMIAIYISVMFVAGKKVRNNQFDGYMTYGQAFVFTLAVGIVGGILTAVYNYLYYEFLDLSFIENQVSEFLYNMEQKGLPEEQLQGIKSKMEKQFSSPPVKQALKGLLSSSIIAVVLALIVSIFVKQNRVDAVE